MDTTTSQPTETRGLQVPLLGYLALESPVSVRPILGAPGAVVVGDPIPLPKDATRVVPAPGQTFGIIERRGAVGIGILQLGVTTSGSVRRIPSAYFHADRIAFSPSGTAVLLYSAALRQAQVVAGLPSSTSISQSIDLTALSAPVTSIALSDDARTVLIGVSDGASGAVWLFSAGQPAQQVARLGLPSAIRFVAGKQDAIIADRGQQQVLLLTRQSQTINLRLLAAGAQGISEPQDLELSSDQQRVWVADMAGGLLSIELSSASVTKSDCPFVPASLSRLRGHSTFLVRSPDNLRFGLWEPETARATVWGLSK